MATFVLVHGAWSGSYVWHLLAPLLRANGHDVYTPSLTGLGERAHLVSHSVNLTTHVADVSNLLYFDDLHDIVLVGHSYGGLVVSGVADGEAGRIAHLVFVDAFVSHLLSRSSPDAERTSAAEEAPDGDWLVPPIPRPLPDKSEEAWLSERRRPMPRACFTEALRLSQPLEERAFSLTYIKATADARENTMPERSDFWRIADRVRNDTRWRYYEIETSHMVQNEKPEELAQLLESACG